MALTIRELQKNCYTALVFLICAIGAVWYMYWRTNLKRVPVEIRELPAVQLAAAAAASKSSAAGDAGGFDCQARRRK